MAMELLFENNTQLDDAVIGYIIEKTFKRDKKTRIYHTLSLVIGLLAAAAAIYLGWLSVLYRMSYTLLCMAVTAVIALYSLYIFFKNTDKKQIEAYQQSYSKSLLIPRKIKVYSNVLYQSAGKSRAEYRLHLFDDIETWGHYFLLHYDKGYVIIDQNGFTTGTGKDFEIFMNKRILKNF